MNCWNFVRKIKKSKKWVGNCCITFLHSVRFKTQWKCCWMFNLYQQHSKHSSPKNYGGWNSYLKSNNNLSFHLQLPIFKKNYSNLIQMEDLRFRYINLWPHTLVNHFSTWEWKYHLFTLKDVEMPNLRLRFCLVF